MQVRHNDNSFLKNNNTINQTNESKCELALFEIKITRENVILRNEKEFYIVSQDELKKVLIDYCRQNKMNFYEVYAK